MTLKEFAKEICGKEYGFPQFTQEEIQKAKDHGFVMVYAASGDLMEFDGAICDEAGCYDGAKVYFNKNGVPCDDKEKKLNMIEAVWCKEKDENGNVIPWSYKTEIPHETFFMFEDGELYCRGIVFNIADLKDSGED